MLHDRGITLPEGRWFRRFFTTHSDIVQEKKSKRENRDRIAKQNEAVIHNHFYGAGGLQDELRDAGVMDPNPRWQIRIFCFSVGLCFFCFFCFSVGFCFLGPKTRGAIILI